MALATSSSDSRLRSAWAAVAVLLAMFVPAAAAVLAVVRLAGGSVWIAFALICALFAAIAATRVVPRWRQLRRATDAADALAHARFDEARVPGSGDEFGPLASALNAAAANIERLVGQLRGERAQLEAMLNASSDATVAVEASGAVAYINDAARQLFGVDAHAIGRPFIEVVRDHDLNDVLIAAARDGDRNVRVVAYGAAQRWLQASAVPIEGGGWAALAVFHDLTEVRRLDSMRRDFISNVSHELRTPLAGIRAAAETLQEGALDDRAAAQEFLGHIQRETDR
ncbi:MAG: HAMP domain-containing protein, partial [Dehalococcoidia bacterium]